MTRRVEYTCDNCGTVYTELTPISDHRTRFQVATDAGWIFPIDFSILCSEACRLELIEKEKVDE